MNKLQVIFIFIAAYLAVFLQSADLGWRRLLGAEIDLLPSIMVYAGMTSSLGLIAVIAFWCGLLFDSVSSTPLGVTVLPLFLIGWVTSRNRELILREQTYAQTVLGLLASAAAPLLSVIILFTIGNRPLVGWGSFWQWIVLILTGGICTPLLFRFFDRLDRAFSYPTAPESAILRGDREIKRGRF